MLDLLLPPLCVACSRLLRLPRAPADLPLCTRCALEAVPLAEGERHHGPITALFAYEGPLARAVTRLKFGGQPALAGPLARLLARAIDPADRWDLLIPLPLHPARAFARGYDQAALLARHLRRAWPHPAPPRLLPRALRRARATRPQTDLDRAGRLANVAGAFIARDPSRPHLAGQRILLLDDVTTTGATLLAGRAALLAAGAAEVRGLALLRALP